MNITIAIKMNHSQFQTLLEYLCYLLSSNVSNKNYDGSKTSLQLSEVRQIQMSGLVGKPTMWFPNRSDTNQTVQSQKRARSLKFRI